MLKQTVNITQPTSVAKMNMHMILLDSLIITVENKTASQTCFNPG